ncbi:MAG: N-acetylmuramoyl-L-alanine amidase [Pseudomonadota bacterium]
MTSPLRRVRHAAGLLALALFAGCASPPIDHSYSSRSQDSRVRFIVIHYTIGNLQRSLNTLTTGEVSSHYLISDDAQPVIYQLVDESRQASHAGVSSWQNYTMLNSDSIGIEIVNPGYRDTPTGRVWGAYPKAQIDALIALLRQIAARHAIKPENILGHSDIAPQRKQDPGPLFPWRQLAQAGLVSWPDAARVAALRPAFERQLPDTAWFQRKLAQHGYAVPQSGQFDEATRVVVAAFQMKYRPTSFAGAPDAETAALLEALTAPAGGPR